jgi:CheY-like chemotaxis protein
MLHSIMIVDDSRAIRRLVRLYVEMSTGWTIYEAENGLEAIEQARSLHPDLIVLDLSMPVMNGLDAARELKAIMPRIPLIIFSEYSNVMSVEEAYCAGISAQVSKSKPISELVGAARSLLDQLAA